MSRGYHESMVWNVEEHRYGKSESGQAAGLPVAAALTRALIPPGTGRTVHTLRSRAPNEQTIPRRYRRKAVQAELPEWRDPDLMGDHEWQGKRKAATLWAL